MEKRLKKVFNESIAIWHSKITKKKKSLILEGLANGKIKVIAGARSALFLPYQSLGLIIVDEEHDESYKADKKPRISVRDIALFLSAKFNIQVILGSATPSLNSYTKVPFVRNKQTYFNTTKSIIFDESTLGINENILNKIDEKLELNQQTIIFLPTRANFKYQICNDCG
jgi:primosomal protein N' (replication factor Y)